MSNDHPPIYPDEHGDWAAANRGARQLTQEHDHQDLWQEREQMATTHTRRRNPTQPELVVPFAVQVQPRTGQLLEEYPTGLRLIGVRPWTAADAKRFPQAERAILGPEWHLVVDSTHHVWLIASPTIEIGDFVHIPAWRTTGQVINLRPALIGSDEAQEVLIQTSPDDPEPCWYRVEPGEYIVLM